MGRSEPERLSCRELIELVLRLQQPNETSRTSSKPPATDLKEQRNQSKLGGVKPSREGHDRVPCTDPDTIIEHRPMACASCSASLHAALPVENVSTCERIELPKVAPMVTQHRRLAVFCPSCSEQSIAPAPGTAFVPRLHAVATYLKTLQALPYDRLQASLSEMFG